MAGGIYGVRVSPCAARGGAEAVRVRRHIRGRQCDTRSATSTTDVVGVTTVTLGTDDEPTAKVRGTVAAIAQHIAARDG